ncbi:Uncharacterised protein [Leclercia adecarboxylata]|uniref:Uncharacterized protein n=1 Tax=Leclercia adecarboxylata TaxID=83655 RepID=A0A4U9IQY8_9ENTR|nr:Uncharacterised protein [Leclercia adecarboxylata]
MKDGWPCLINNLGGVSALEMALLTKELAHSALKIRSRILLARHRW